LAIGIGRFQQALSMPLRILSGEKLLAFASAFLYHVDIEFDHAFEGREPFLARQTVSSPANCEPIIDRTRIDHLVVVVLAERTLHRASVGWQVKGSNNSTIVYQQKSV
jgi:hypothetical protein